MITSTSHVHLSCNGLASTTLCDHERKKSGRWRSETTANWANSLSQRHNLALFFSPHSLYSRGSLVRLIVPSFTHILPLSHERWGRFISYLLNFIKHPSRQHSCIFHFLVSTGIVQKGSVAENGETREREGKEGWLRPTIRSMSFLLPLSFSYSMFLFLPVIFLFICTRGFVSLLRCLHRSVRCHHPVSTCFTFKSSCRACSLESRNGVCTHILHYSRFTTFYERVAILANASSVVRIRLVRFKMKGVQNDSENDSDKLSLLVCVSFLFRRILDAFSENMTPVECTLRSERVSILDFIGYTLIVIIPLLTW